MGQLFRLFLVFTFLFSAALVTGQSTALRITGIVVDTDSKAPVPYATVLLKSTATEELIDGTTSAADGSFTVSSDSSNVYLDIGFIGYESNIIREFNVQNGVANLGKIGLSQGAQDIDEVEVIGERSTVEFKLDKRVFNVGTDISSSGMGAMDVLNNVPSVDVNIDGQVSLRGNSGVQILINGKPSVLADDGSNALGSITSDMIESIEIITNPSAKYEAGGTSGIINIILKKEDEKGFNGSVSLNAGIPENYSVGGSLNRRTENFNFFTQFGVGYRVYPRYNNTRNINRQTGSILESKGVEFRNENYYNITLGTDYFINDLNVLTLSGNFAYEIEDQPSETEFTLYNPGGELASRWKREEFTDAVNPKWQYDLQYKKEFRNNEDHVLLFSTLGSFFGKTLESDFVNTAITGDEALPNQQTETSFYRADYTVKLDYTNPISERITIETGGQYDFNDVGNDYAVSNLSNGVWVPDSGLTNNFEFNQKVLGVYGTGAYEDDRWGVKLGIRAENTDLQTMLTTTDEVNSQNYTNFFPTFHASYKISSLIQLQGGYSKRIFRPRLWDLNPFFNIRNNFNIRRGNPNLQPEFADSYEITGIFFFDNFSLNTSVYHLYSTDVVERVSTFEDNVNIVTPMNIGSNRKTGVEVNGKYTPTKWLTVNGDFNYGYFNRQGSFELQNFNFRGEQWSTRLTTRVNLPYDIDLEVSGNYRSAFQTVQSQVSAYAFMNAGLRKKLWKGKAIVDFSVSDVFASRIFESVIDRIDVYQYSFGQRGRFFTLGFSYSFGKGEAMTYSGKG